MATIRIECSADGFEENWIEYSAAWTRGDTKRLDSAGDEGEILELITSKVVRCPTLASSRMPLSAISAAVTAA